MGIYWQTQYYVDLYLPFGLRSAPFLFNQFSNALEWILQIKSRPTGRAPYFGHFFIAELKRLQCLTSFSTLLRFFVSLQLPWWPQDPWAVGQHSARLPKDKLSSTREMLNSFTQRRSARLFELQSRIGTLQFACKAVVPGRTFLQRMINLTKGIPAVFTSLDVIGSSLKIWRSGKTFLADWNGRSFFSQHYRYPLPENGAIYWRVGYSYCGYFN